MIVTNKQISTHFHSSEFKCKCGCGAIYIDEGLITKLEHVFSKLKASRCIISSGYRCPSYDKKIGGFVGYHAKGLAADCIFYDKNGKVIPSSIVICVAYDLGELKGMAKINNNYTHFDNRPEGTYKGDETKSNNSCWTNPYSYFGVSKAEVVKYTGEVVSSLKYQSHGVGKCWYENVKIGSSEYAGVFKIPMDGLYIDNLEYRVKVNGKWLPPVKGRTDYAGILGKSITAIAIKGATYRIHTIKDGWLPWVSGYNINDFNNGYAGNGNIIDAVQIK